MGGQELHIQTEQKEYAKDDVEDHSEHSSNYPSQAVVKEQHKSKPVVKLSAPTIKQQIMNRNDFNMLQVLSYLAMSTSTGHYVQIKSSPKRIHTRWALQLPDSNPGNIGQEHHLLRISMC